MTHEASQTFEKLVEESFAKGNDCPSVEAIAQAVLEECPQKLEEVERHTRGCGACEAELALALTWQNAEDDRDDLESHVVRRISGRLSPIQGQGTRTRGRQIMAALAVAAAGVLVALSLPIGNSPPPLPERTTGTDQTVRGERIDVVFPTGAGAVSPELLQWQEIAGAESYRVVIRRVDGEVVFETTTTKDKVELDLEVEPHVRYLWQVEAFAGETLLASSEHTSFSFSPERNDEGE